MKHVWSGYFVEWYLARGKYVQNSMRFCKNFKRDKISARLMKHLWSGPFVEWYLALGKYVQNSMRLCNFKRDKISARLMKHLWSGPFVEWYLARGKYVQNSMRSCNNLREDEISARLMKHLWSGHFVEWCRALGKYIQNSMRLCKNFKRASMKIQPGSWSIYDLDILWSGILHWENMFLPRPDVRLNTIMCPWRIKQLWSWVLSWWTSPVDPSGSPVFLLWWDHSAIMRWIFSEVCTRICDQCDVTV
jgi:hypothetical protein